MNDEEREISVQDLLRVVWENLKLLILGPLLVGLIAWSAARFAPQNFTSYAILLLPEVVRLPTPFQTATVMVSPSILMVSPSILDPVIAELKLTNGRSIQVTRKDIANNIKVYVKDGLVLLDVTAHAPMQAQAIANAVIDTWLKSTFPAEQERADLEKRLSYAEKSLNAVTQLINQLSNESAANLNKPLSRGEVGSSFPGLGELQIRFLGEVLNISRQMRGLTREVVKQAPTLPTEPESPKSGLIAILAAVFAGVILLAWVLGRHVWRKSTPVPLL